MSKGYDSAERETRERVQSPALCDAYACAEFATVRVGDRNLCDAHRPPSVPPQGEASTSPANQAD